MKREWLREPGRFAHRPRIVLHFMALLVMMGCGASNNEGGGGGGAGGISNGGGGTGAGNVVANESETIDDARWNAPDGVDQAVAPTPSAIACTSPSDCASGSCADGVCCDAACDYPCMACTAAKKGSGVDGVCGSVAYDTDPDNECTDGACDGKNVCKRYNGATCSLATQCLSKYCVDGYCCGNICMGECQACSAAKKGGGNNGACGNIATTTDPDNECNPGECNGSGACTAAQIKSANGAACISAAQCSSGFCADGVCCDSWCLGTCQACTAAKKGQGTDGTCGNMKYDADPDDECWSGSCDGTGLCKQYNGHPCISTSNCLSGNCADGYCCGSACTGACSACSAAKKGQGNNGGCGPIAATKDPDNECSPGECNGSGGCNQPQTLQANGAVCVTSVQCVSGFCTDGVCCDRDCGNTCEACTATKKGSGINGTCGLIASETNPDNECNGGRCDGFGACRYYNGAPCTSTGQCFSKYCVDGVCCGNVCTGSCQACSAVKKGQGGDGSCGAIANTKDPDNECNPGECNGASACNQSQTLQANGTACVTSSQCTSGFCTDGVCCDVVCSGLCQACTATKKGSGADGTCGNIKYDADPDNECYAGSCGGDGTCKQLNGLPCTTTAQCLSNYCVDGVCCGGGCTNTCYACSALKKGQGGDGSCGPIASGKDLDNECNPGECNGSGACNQTLQANGTVCTTAGQCTSGFCRDGVCCDAACTGLCVACTAAKKGSGADGTCGNINYDADPDNECAAGSCGGDGTCKQVNGLPCTTTAQCLSNYCVDGFCCGNGCTQTCYSCSAAKKGTGNNGSCGPMVLGSNPDGECTGGTCNGSGACVSLLGNASACSVNGECSSGFCVDGVCCDSLCAGSCMACNVAGVEGTCSSSCAGACIGTVGLPNFPAGPFLTPHAQTVSQALGDMNGDGLMDLVVGHKNYYSLDPRVSVMLNLGNGRFAGRRSVNIEAPSEPAIHVAVGDLNADGRLDVAIANEDNIRVTINLGNNIFGYSLNRGWGDVLGLSTADMNGDNKGDLVYLVGKTYDFVSMSLGPLHPGVGTGKQVTAGHYPKAFVVKDFTGDGQTDIATTLTSNSLSIVLNQGAGNFAAPVLFPTTAIDAIVTADFNNDGSNDVALLNRSQASVSLMFNQGNGTFGAAANMPTNASPLLITAADVTADGLSDVIVVNTSTVSVHRNQGSGTFVKVDYAVSTVEPTAIGVHDFNSDGRADLAITEKNSVRMLYQHADGSYGEQPVASYVNYPTGLNPVMVATADFNNDGNLDLISSNPGDSTVSVLLGNGDGTFASKIDSPTTWVHSGAFTVGDVNADAFPDLAIIQGGVSIMIGQGNGTFALPVHYGTSMSSNSVVLADFDGDGFKDLASSAATAGVPQSHISKHHVTVRMNQGNGTFGVPIFHDLGGDEYSWYGVSNQMLAAFKSSSGPGMYLVYTNPDLYDVQTIGNPTVPSTQGGSPAAGDHAPKVIVSANLMGDGSPEAVIATADGFSWLQVREDPGGSAQAGVRATMGEGGWPITSGDINGDGHDDLVVLSGNEARVFMNWGNANLGVMYRYAMPPGASSIAVGDFNGDGRADIATNSANNNIAVMLSTCLP